MIRVRFEQPTEDYRPITFPPPHPYWCSGYSLDNEMNTTPILIAFLNNEEELYQYWPEAENPEFEEVDEVTFSDRFPKPDWYNPAASETP